MDFGIIFIVAGIAFIVIGFMIAKYKHKSMPLEKRREQIFEDYEKRMQKFKN